jgi:hypothetical protein
VRYLGLFLFLLSILPAGGGFGGFESALWAIGPWPWLHDDKISYLAGFGGWLNPKVLLLFCLFVSGRGQGLRPLLVVTILFPIPMTWIAIYRMDQTANIRVPPQSRPLSLDRWNSLDRSPGVIAFRFTPARWLAAGVGMVIAVMSIPIIIGFTMRAPSEADDLHYDQACNTAECAKIDPNGSADPINAIPGTSPICSRTAIATSP